MAAETWVISDFCLGKRLGGGRFGQVYWAQEKKSMFVVAMKVLNISRRTNHEQIKIEIEIQYHLRHPNILKLFGYFFNDHFVHLVMEYASGGNLHDLMIEQSQKRFAEPQAAKFVFELCSALAYCHALKVIHRDIKPENLVLDEEGSLKVTDFGSCVHSRDSNGFWKLQSTVCGTLDYLAPELVEEKLYKETVDCWCVGILCFELLTGKPPFAKPSPADTKRAIVHNDITFPSFVSPTAKDLIRRLLFKDPAGRLAMEQALEHPWIKEHIGLEKRKEALERIPLIFSPQPS